MNAVPAGESCLRHPFTVLAYPFRHTLTGHRRRERLPQLQGRWKPWWGRLNGPDEREVALDDTFFFLPYVRELLFPEVGGRTAAELASLTLANLADVPDDAVVRLTRDGELVQALRLDFERRGGDGRVIDSFHAPFDLCWIDAVLFPHEVGFLLLKVRLTEEPTVARLSEFLSLVRLLHPPAVGWQLATWRRRDADDPPWQGRDLIDFLLQGLTDRPDLGHGNLGDWLTACRGMKPEERDTGTPFGQVFGQVFHLYSFACLRDAEATAAAKGPFPTATHRTLYELATCTDTSDPVYLPDRDHLEQLFGKHLLAFWDNWSGLALHDNVVFLGKNDGPFLTRSLAHNVESDYLHLYVYTLFQKTWLSLAFGSKVRKRGGAVWGGSPSRRLLDEFLHFQNRYWFVEITRKPLPVALYRLYQHGLDVEPLYKELSEQVHALHNYYEQQSLRRQSRLLASVSAVALPASVMANLFGTKLLSEGRWWQALVLLGALYGLLILLWLVWNRIAED
jgi:hypothetical protein